jgi:uncharacterized membrane protein YjjP (DUF1212 family)
MLQITGSVIPGRVKGGPLNWHQGYEMSAARLQMELLLQAGRLLLEYNESTGAIHGSLMATARALTDDTCHVVVSYGGVTVFLGEEVAARAPVKELRYNTALQARVHEILGQLRRGDLDSSAALVGLKGLESATPPFSRWLAVPTLGAGAGGLAALSGADGGAAAVAGVATSLGLLVRQELGRLRFCLLAQPLTAAFIGAVLGGLAIRLGWTRSLELVLIVPALMLVPGPHLINGLLDLIDNYLPMTLSRLGLAAGILLATALGIVLGVELMLPGPLLAEHGGNPPHLNLPLNTMLAGIVTCSFAVFYNTAWRHLGMAILGGMAGHGLRYVGLEMGWSLEAATFLGGLTVGAMSAWMARRSRTPVAVIAFAGAVTMIPGSCIYRALGGALQLARLPSLADAATVTTTLVNTFQACLVVGALALGLIGGARAVLALAGDRDTAVGSRVDAFLGQAGRLRPGAETRQGLINGGKNHAT